MLAFLLIFTHRSLLTRTHFGQLWVTRVEIFLIDLFPICADNEICLDLLDSLTESSHVEVQLPRVLVVCDIEIRDLHRGVVHTC